MQPAAGLMRSDGTSSDPGKALRRGLLGCGIAATGIYLGANVVAPLQWPGYSPASQAVSELAAVDAPTRAMFTTVSVVTSLLTVAFGIGVWLSARPGQRALRVTGALLAASALVGLPLHPFFPMHLRGVERTMSDTMHIVLVGVSTPLTLGAMGFGAASLGRRLRVYSIVSLVIVFVFGVLSGIAGSRIDTGDTAWMGVDERVSFAAYYAWSVVLAVALLRRSAAGDETADLASASV